MKPIGPLSLQVLQLLSELGAMTNTDIAAMTGRSVVSCNDSIRRLRKRKLVHICKYERQPDGQSGSLIPIYAVGDLPDAKRPKRIDHNEVSRKSWARRKAILSIRRYPEYNQGLGIFRGLM